MGLRLITELFDLIPTSIDNALRRLLLKDVQLRHYIDERPRNYQNNVWDYNADWLHKRGS
jgi:hypothetical protein